MNVSELLEAFRSDLRDTEEPYLWSDADVYRYIDWAQKSFCRQTEGIEDSRTLPLSQLNIVVGEQWYPISPLILKLRSATRSDTGADVPIVAAERVNDLGIRFDGRIGPLRYLVAGLDKNTLRAWPVPSEAVTVGLSVFRLPLRSITGADGQRLEIDEHHHEQLLDGMKHRAYLKQDADTFDRSRSTEFAQLFDAYCEKAKREQVRARRPVGTVQFGGL